MTIYIVKMKKDKFVEVRIEAENEKEARIKIENNDYDPINNLDMGEGYWEIVEIRKAK